MPNGGSDCCGTCWFNRLNEGKAGYNKDLDPLTHYEGYCEIRTQSIPHPMYTYCSNHPYYNPKKHTIPVGPIYTDEPRRIWKKSPDTEEIRLFLLNYLSSISEELKPHYPFGIPLDDAVIIQLNEFKEIRASKGLQRILSFDPLTTPAGKNPFVQSRTRTFGIALVTLAVLQRDESLSYIRKAIAVLENPKLKPEERKHLSLLNQYILSSLELCQSTLAKDLLRKFKEKLEKAK